MRVAKAREDQAPQERRGLRGQRGTRGLESPAPLGDGPASTHLRVRKAHGLGEAS